MIGLIGKKIGMTQIFNEVGHLMPVTVIQVEPNTVVALKDKEKFGYSSVVLGLGELKEKHTSKPYAGQFSGDIKPLKLLKEFRDFDKEVAVGDKLGVEAFEKVSYLDITAISKGKGFQGVVKRHGFGGVGQSTHGQDDRARKPGSIGACSYPAKVFKGMRMAGQMGGDRVTTQNLQVLKVIPEHNLLLVKGSVAGCNGSTVLIKK